jgi:hypothetical protein
VTGMQKMDLEKNVHADFYRKEGNTIVSATWLRDAAHDVGVEVEVDMDKLVVTDAKFMFDRYPEKKCALVKDLEKSLIGMTVGNGVGDEILRRFGGKNGCENIMTLLLLGTSGIVFVHYIDRLKSGAITHADFARDIPMIRNNACIAFNPDIPY